MRGNEGLLQIMLQAFLSPELAGNLPGSRAGWINSSSSLVWGWRAARAACAVIAIAPMEPSSAGASSPWSRPTPLAAEGHVVRQHEGGAAQSAPGRGRLPVAHPARAEVVPVRGSVVAALKAAESRPRCWYAVVRRRFGVKLGK